MTLAGTNVVRVKDNFLPAVGSPKSTYGVRSQVFDALIALGSTFLSISILLSFLDSLSGLWRPLVFLLVLVHNLSLFWRRRTPWTSYTINLVSGVALAATGLPMVVLHLAPLIAVYSVSSRAPRPRALCALAATLIALMAGEIITDSPDGLSTIVGNLVAIVSAWLLGAFVFARQTYVERLELRTRELDAARGELAHTAVIEERLRIARELHDVVAHSLSMIAVQSGVGGHVLDEQPEEARRSLAAIEDVSRKALDEMRVLLGVLRDGEQVSLGPAPGLSELDNLVTRVSSAGTKVTVRMQGEARSLPPGLDLTAYRIVQESLTNVVKHAHATCARMVLTYAPDRLVIEVVDDGRGPVGGLSDGHGLDGMRERVQIFGGSLTAGPLRDGGFRVHAELPFSEDSA